MAGRGRAPSGKRARERDEKRDAAAVVTVEPTDDLHGPELPPPPVFILGAGENVDFVREWPAATLRWWESFRRSPQAALLLATDWDFLADTAVLHGYFWYGDTRHAAELRLRVAKFGATIEDRMRLRIQAAPLKSDQPAPPAKVAPPVDRDAVILQLVADAG